MPINFNTLVTSENELRHMFLDYYLHVINMQEKLIVIFKSNKKMSEKDWKELHDMEKVCNMYEAKILDETSWIISKDMPRAAHLRYLIAVIRSIKDLERMGDFAFNVAKYIYHYKVDRKIRSILSKIATKSLHVVKVFYKNLENPRGQSKEYYTNSATKQIQEFSADYKQHFKQLGQLIFDSEKKLGASSIGAFTAAKNIERNADHAFNIIENFTYISEGNFYFTNESRKGF